MASKKHHSTAINAQKCFALDNPVLHAVIDNFPGMPSRRRQLPASAEDLALGILAVSEGLAPLIQSALAVSGPASRLAIMDRQVCLTGSGFSECD